MSTPTVLPANALAQLTPVATAPAPRYAVAALCRAALYLSPLLLALAAAEPLARLPWQLPAAALATGWCALSVFAALGRLVRVRSGPVPAARQVLAGFALVTAAWSGVLAVTAATPAWLPEPLAGLAAEPVTAYAVSLPALALAAAVGVGVATGTEPTVLRWSLPLAGTAVAIAGGWLAGPVPLWPGSRPQPVELLLVAGIALPLLRMAVLAWDPRGRHRVAAPAAPGRPLGGGLRTSGCHLLYGAAQAGLVLTAWQLTRSTPAADGVPPGVLPLLLTLPAVEWWLGWHLSRTLAGLARYDDRGAHQRYVHRLAWCTLGALLPALVAGTALLAAASRLPYGLSRHPDPPALLHALATGVLLAGLLALGALLAARGRPGLAALVTGAPLLAIPALTAGPLVDGVQLAALPAALAAAYALGLVLAANLLFDPRAGVVSTVPAAGRGS